MNIVSDRTPVIVGVGEVTHRNKEPALGIEPLELMARALVAAQLDAGVEGLLASLDSLDVVYEYSWPYSDAPGLLSKRLGTQPARRVYGQTGGESPVRFVHEAALRIARGESLVAAVTGAESRYTVDAADKLGVTLPWCPRDLGVKLVRGPDICHPAAVRHGASIPANIYPFYENAALAYWGQTPREALKESAALWSRYSQVAADNPYAWSRKALTTEQVGAASDSNRMICWPYTRSMVANPLVNMGAGVLMTSLGRARELGIAEDRLVFVWGGAAANEPRDYLQRDQFVRSHAQDMVMETVLGQVGGDARAFAMFELYSCFPIVPKMARRTLRLDADAQMTSTGGLSFFGAPSNNYMTHAVAGSVRALRQAPGKSALLYGQGELVTKHHALVLGSTPPTAGLPQHDYSVQAAADARRGRVPELVLDHVGEAVLETFTILYDRGNAVDHGVVIARTPEGGRLMARVEPDDAESLGVLTDMDQSPVGRKGAVTRESDALLRWRVVP